MPQINKITDNFGAEVSGLELSKPMSQEDIDLVKGLIDQYAVLIIKSGEAVDDESLTRFTSNFGEFHKSITANRMDMTRRLKGDVLSDISNVGKEGDILSREDPRRIQQLANLIWHTDNSFRKPAGLYTFLAARIVPPADGETEFADTRAAYDSLSDEMKAKIADLQVEHSLAHSRFLVGTEKVFDAEEAKRFPATLQPLVRRQELTGRKALYIGSHAWRVVGWNYEDSQALLGELLEISTRPEFVFRHKWTVGDVAMWDNRVSLHRGLPFDDVNHRRDLRR
ncbi:TauD/TfdA family dioxygenase, partial [Sphingobium sp.]|uniref:TauD/TfdA dioxygenase family protein n=1 Tax=Sphingobium sp. TaxID=1912891 RepID=UPI002CBB03FD